MRFQCESKNLLDSCDMASSVIRNSHVPVLKCLHLIAGDGGKLRVFGSNMDIEIQSTSSASISEMGSATIHAASLVAFLKSASGVLDFELRDHVATLSCRSSKARLIENSGPFPRMERPDVGQEVILGPEALKFCAGYSDGERFETSYRSGVYFCEQFAIATSSARIAVFNLASPVSGNIPAIAAATIGRLKSPRLFIGPNSWRAESEGCAAVGKLIQDGFPSNFESIVARGKLLFSCDADEFLLALQSASIGQAREVFIEARDSLNLSGEALSADVSSCSSECSADVDVECAFALKSDQAVKALSALRGRVVNFHQGARTIQIIPAAYPGEIHFAQVKHPKTLLPEIEEVRAA